MTEIAIPAPSPNRDYASLPTAQILRPFATLATLQSSSGIAVMDLLVLEKQGAQATDKIHVTLGDGYLPQEPLKTYSTAELDFLVDTLVAAPGVYGARLSGGGFGGAVMALAGPSFGATQADAVAAAYAAKFGARPDILPMGTGEGATVL